MSSQQHGASGPRQNPSNTDVSNEGGPQASTTGYQATPTTQPFLGQSGPETQANAGTSSTPTSGIPAPATERGLPRPLGVQSILNPSHPEPPTLQNRRRTASEMELSSISESDVRALPAPSFRLDSSGSSQPQSSPAPGFAGRGVEPAEPRHTLLARSPIRPLASLNLTNLSSAGQSPFLSPRARLPASDLPGSVAPLLPTPPAAPRLGYNFPPRPAPTPPLSTGRRASAGAALRTQSASASPSTSYSSYSHTGQTSPAGPVPPGTTRSVSYGSLPALPTTTRSSGPPVTLEPDRQYGFPVASTGQSSYQILTLETQQGPVQVPVDVQAASRVADEKRKRNAGASARFRQRRKEKEREASTTISRLEQQLREAGEDIEFYRRERDTLGNLLFQTPGGERHFPRPPSPRQQRVPAPPGTASGPSTGSSGSTAFPRFPERTEPADQDRRVRRRMSAYSLPAPTQAAHMAYPPQSYPPLMPAPSEQATAPARQVQTTGPQQQGQPASSRAMQYDPYQAQRFDRSWPPGPSREGR